MAVLARGCYLTILFIDLFIKYEINMKEKLSLKSVVSEIAFR